MVKLVNTLGLESRLLRVQIPFLVINLFGGIGRRDRLKICSKLGVGSNPIISKLLLNIV